MATLAKRDDLVGIVLLGCCEPVDMVEGVVFAVAAGAFASCFGESVSLDLLGNMPRFGFYGFRLLLGHEFFHELVPVLISFHLLKFLGNFGVEFHRNLHFCRLGFCHVTRFILVTFYIRFCRSSAHSFYFLG